MAEAVFSVFILGIAYPSYETQSKLFNILFLYFFCSQPCARGYLAVRRWLCNAPEELLPTAKSVWQRTKSFIC